MLTIDGNIQYELEKIARSTMDETKAEAVMMIAADARTGEILAYVSEPSANLNTYGQSPATARKDRPALYAYEPGSVFKIFSIASLMDLGLVKDSDLFLCDGAYTFTTSRGETINIKCLEHHGWVTARDVIKLSCNDGSAQMAERADAAAFEQKLRDFGFGSKTGIELPGETSGIFSPNQFWSLRSKPTIAIGQEISVSALQMVEAATALANGGTTLKLTLLSKLYTRDGLPVYEHRPQSLKQVISPETARLMLGYMRSTSESGTGTRASVGDVPMAVKTGTAQMLNEEHTGYSTTDYISSCMGIFPANDPQVILYLAIIKPVGETYGGRIAAPVISKAANAIIDYLGIGRSGATSVKHTGLIPVPRNRPVEIGSVMPDLSGIPKRMLSALLTRTDITVLIDGDGYVITQSPPAGTPIEKGTTIELHLE
jgi:cell division protein FtsI (penicillin-binding protein 3)